MTFRSADDTAGVGDHGGSLSRARALFPRAPEPWVDLSTGINPHPYRLLDLPATALTRLPDEADARQLEEIAAKAYGAPSPRHVVAAPGTQILLPRVAALIAPGNARVLGPTYAEHRRALALAGHEVEEVVDFEALRDADIAVIVNPNNPDGRVISRARLLELGLTMRGHKGLIIVDEAFMDVGLLAESVAADVADVPIVVLRSFGKFYGLAGVRLGFAIASEKYTHELSAELGPWAVAGPALAYGAVALADSDWRDATRARLAREAAALDALLERRGLTILGGTSLFQFVGATNAPALFEAFGAHGVWVRNFQHRADVLRLGLPADAGEFARVEEALGAWARDAGATP